MTNTQKVFEDLLERFKSGNAEKCTGGLRRNGFGGIARPRIILNELEHQGEMKLGHNVKIGYFAQNQAQLLDENLSVLETIDQIAVGDVRTKIRDILGAFMFSGEDVANMTEEALSRFLGSRALRDKARAYMAAAKDAGKVSEENAALRVQVSDLTEQLQAMRSRLAALENSDEARRGPGRPRKEAA